MPARNGDWTRFRNRASPSSERVALELARRAENVRSSTEASGLSVVCRRRITPRTVPSRTAVIRALVLFDQRLHAHCVSFTVTMAADGRGAAAGLDNHI